MRFQILGPFEVYDEQGRELVVGGPKQRAVLAILLLQAGQTVATERLIDELWGESPPRSAANTVQVYVSNLRKALGDGVLSTRPAGYQLERTAVELDAEEFGDLVTEARRALKAAEPGSAHRLLVRALGLWRGAALAEFAYEQFAQGEIARLEEARITASEDRSDALLAIGGDAGLVADLERLIRDHPLRERLRGQLMLALYRAGRQADALDAYREARERLVDELGIEPSEELRSLQAAMLNQEPSLTVSAAASDASDAADLGVLPRRGRPVIGRERELRELASLLTDPDVSLLTLTGAGGIGKTTLALEAARQANSAFPDGVTVIWLASTVDDQQVVSEVARVLGITPAPDEPLLDRLVRVLRGQERLLVVDNFEHLLPAAPVIAALADGCPRLKLLVTSRAPLRVGAEHVLKVAPLAVPDPGAGAVRDSAAAALFIDRARSGDPSYLLSEADEDALGELCRYVGGVPLALELAAARAPVLSVASILERLRHSSEELGPARRDAPERHRSLRATIEWSTNLIGADERALFARLSVFGGGFTAEAAEAVSGALGISVMDGLSTLLDQGLIHRVPARQGTRLAMLEPIRDYAREQLRADPLHDEVMLAFAEHFATLAENAGSGMASHAQVRWIERLDDEQANLRAVMYGASSPSELEAALRIAGALTDYWLIRVLALDIDGWLGPVLARHTGEPVVRSRALYTFGARAYGKGDLKRAADALTECASISQQLGNAQLALLSEARLAWILHLMGADDEADAHRDRAAAALAIEPDPLARAQARDWIVFRGEVDSDEVRASLEAYHRAAEAAGDLMRLGSTGLSLGVEAMIVGNYSVARDWFERAVGFLRPTWGHQLDGAIEANLGQIALYEGNTAEARERLTNAARDAVRLGEPDKLQEVLVGLAAAAASEAKAARAGRLLATAHAVHDGAMSQEAEALLDHFLLDVQAGPEDAAVAPGTPIGMRELGAIVGEPVLSERSQT
jgi:predicted ATPase/DNA-binding SARP family transcriptional activator